MLRAGAKLEPLRLWRSFFYVPGDAEKKIAKMAKLASDIVERRDLAKLQSHLPDAIVLDCEDGVAGSAKVAAREGIARTLRQDSFRPFRQALQRTLLVRINPLDTGLTEADLQVCVDQHDKLDHICLPKTESLDQLKWLADRIKGTGLLVIGMIESPEALLHMSHMCRGSILEGVPLRGFVFGSDDYCARLGVARSDSNVEVSYARKKFVNVCKSFGLTAIDMVDIDLHDTSAEKVTKNTRLGAQLGFDGKQLIHPKQIPIAHEAFSPREQSIDWSRRLLAEATQSGAGAFTFEGKMIDMPTMRQAENTLKKAQLLRGDGLNL
ncbi:hypothetical protein Ciccas_007666 [Cichlidogyrus casuarinus]|uniref:HpcH/HpaI aldolase/citrate lyase domain-containing protein n=1 Tax=Cichlidogyrus casuarinus TaxID=1844966 RepID=A0ABD2Q280_9PLAT